MKLLKLVALKLFELLGGVLLLLGLIVIMLFTWLDLEPNEWPRVNATCNAINEWYNDIHCWLSK